MDKPVLGEESTLDSILSRLQYKLAKRSTARKQRQEKTKHLQHHQKYKKKQRRSKASEQLQNIEPGDQAKEKVDGAGNEEDTTYMAEEGGTSSRTSDYNAIDQYDANLGTVGSETAATLASGRPSAHPLAGNPGTMSTELSGVQDVQTRPLAPKPPSNPGDITAMSTFPTTGVSRHASPAADLLIVGKMFREMEAEWYQRMRDLEADLHRRYADQAAELHRQHTEQEADLNRQHAELHLQHTEREADLNRQHEKSTKKLYKGMEERSVEITRLTCLALAWETEKMKMEENFNLRGALERIAFHGRLIKKIECPQHLGVQAALDELAKTKRFQTHLAAEVRTRRLVKKDVARCIAGVYHQASRLAHGNSGTITIFEEDHTPNERAALATFLRVQGEWEDCLEWKEVKRGE